MKKHIALTLALLILPFAQLKAQAITTQELLDSWDIMTKMVVESAKKMPAEHFTFSPYEPLRNFANQINHTTASNFGFARVVQAGRPDFPLPNPNNPPQNKEAVVDILEKSFAHFRSGLEQISEDQFSDMIDWGPANNRRQIPRLRAILIVFSHLQREHGKTMMYLRAKGIAPPPAGSFGG